MKKILKYTGRLIKKFLPAGKVILKNELLPEGGFTKPNFPAGILRAWMTGSEESAEKICKHEFDLLGSGLKKLGANIDWQKDFSDRGEIKVPWELSRFQFLPTLAKAGKILKQVQDDNTDNTADKYAAEAKNLIHDWILKNPLGKGVNWQCPMEAAIRASNFALAWHFLQDSESWKNKEWHETFLTSIAEHGKFVMQNLEYRFFANTNHLIADLTGLFLLGVLFPQFKTARKWKAHAVNGLENEMREQVYEDGVSYESSIPYHRLVCELFGFCTLFANDNNVYFSREFLVKLEKMFEFAWYYTKPNGLAPQIGDNDDGRLFVFEDFYSWERRDHRFLFKLAEKLFPLNNLFVRGERNTAKPTSKGFNESRIFIMRKDDFYCIVDSGNVGQHGHGGHAHNDNLSFELSVTGEDFIIDPGAYIYTSDPLARRHFRSTKMHNTVMVDNKEMNRFKPYTLFSIHNDAIPQINKWDSNEKYDELDAEHSGYKRLKNPVVHRRVFRFDKTKSELGITDHFTGEGDHELEWNLHFAPGVNAQKSGNKIFAEKNGVKITMELPADLAKHAEIYDDEVSPRYGVKESTKALKIIFKTTIKQDTRFNLSISIV